MADEQDQKAGTTNPSDTGDDAAKAALAESASGADRDAESEGQDEGGKRIDWKARFLTEGKPAQEKANRLEKELEELRDQLAQQKSPTDDQQAQNENRELQELAQDLAECDQRYRETGEPVYKVAANAVRMQLVERQERVIERRAHEAKQSDGEYLATATVIGDDGEERLLTAKERQELVAFQKRNHSIFPGGTLEAAHDAMLGKQFRKSAAEIARERTRLKRDAERRDEGVVSTHHRDVSASESRAKRMTQSQFDTKVNQLEADGRADEAFRLKQDAYHGRISLSG